MPLRRRRRRRLAKLFALTVRGGLARLLRAQEGILAGLAGPKDAAHVNSHRGRSRFWLVRYHWATRMRWSVVSAAFLLVASGWVSACQKCPPTCPGQNLSTTVVDVTLPSSKAVSGVDATMTGPVNGRFSCESGACFWEGPELKAGSYTLQVSAPGYETTTQQETVTISQFCGCSEASIQPSTVSLSPADGGSD